MGIWNLYFVLALALSVVGAIDFHIGWNLALAASLLPTLHSRWQKGLRQIVAIPAGLALLYSESALPPIPRLIAQLPQLNTFSPQYALELAQRFINIEWITIGAACAVGLWLLNHWLRTTTFVLIACLVVPLSLKEWPFFNPIMTQKMQPGGIAKKEDNSPAELDAALKTFEQQERERKTIFPAVLEAEPSFDIIVLHICSLAWEDFKNTPAQDHPFFNQLDLLFTQFSTGASYSGPAAIRLLRASCGQPTHQSLYTPADTHCLLFSNLQTLGFQTEATFNHDGHFDRFKTFVESNLGVSHTPVTLPKTAEVGMKAFDGSPIWDDYSVLTEWMAQRVKTGSIHLPTALYYNTISLHDGNQLPQDPRSSLATYPFRLKKLFDGFQRFIQSLEQQKRRAVIVFVPEHGAALHGDAHQMAGLREIPTAAISRVPVGVKLVGLPTPFKGTLKIDQPSSYLALSQLLAFFAAQNPFAVGRSLEDYVAGLPQTEFVAQNEETIVMARGGSFFTRTPDGVWIPQKTKH